VRGEGLSADLDLHVGLLRVPDCFRELSAHDVERRRHGHDDSRRFRRHGSLDMVAVGTQMGGDRNVAQKGEAVVLEMLPLVQILVFDEGVPARGKAVLVEEVIRCGFTEGWLGGLVEYTYLELCRGIPGEVVAGMFEEEGDVAFVTLTAVRIAPDTPVVAANAELARSPDLPVGRHVGNLREPVNPEYVGAGRLPRGDG
jgi:hypothetical protein